MGVLKLQPKRRAKGGPDCNPSLTKILPFVFREDSGGQGEL